MDHDELIQLIKHDISVFFIKGKTIYCITNCGGNNCILSCWDNHINNWCGKKIKLSVAIDLIDGHYTTSVAEVYDWIALARSSPPTINHV